MIREEQKVADDAMYELVTKHGFSVVMKALARTLRTKRGGACYKFWLPVATHIDLSRRLFDYGRVQHMRRVREGSRNRGSGVHRW